MWIVLSWTLLLLLGTLLVVLMLVHMKAPGS